MTDVYKAPVYKYHNRLPEGLIKLKMKKRNIMLGNFTSKEIKMCIDNFVGVCMQEARAPQRIPINDVSDMAGQLGGESTVQNYHLRRLHALAAWRSHHSPLYFIRSKLKVNNVV